MKLKKNPKMTGAASTRGLGKAVAGALLVSALVGAHAWTRVEGTLVGYRLSSAQADQEDLLREQRELELELATRRAAARIEGDARKRLGLVEPRPDEIFGLPALPQPEEAHADAAARVGR